MRKGYDDKTKNVAYPAKASIPDDLVEDGVHHIVYMCSDETHWATPMVRTIKVKNSPKETAKPAIIKDA